MATNWAARGHCHHETSCIIAEATARVLVIEDDPTLAHAVARNLEVRGHSVWSTSTAEEAIKLLDEHQPAILLLDIDLPDGSGWEVARHNRSHVRPALIIVMSALRPNPRLAAALDVAGALEKPFPMETLLDLVARLETRQAEEDESRA